MEPELFGLICLLGGNLAVSSKYAPYLFAMARFSFWDLRSWLSVAPYHAVVIFWVFLFMNGCASMSRDSLARSSPILRLLTFGLLGLMILVPVLTVIRGEGWFTEMTPWLSLLQKMVTGLYCSLFWYFVAIPIGMMGPIGLFALPAFFPMSLAAFISFFFQGKFLEF